LKGYSETMLVLILSGVGRLIAEARTTPVVVPFWHIGMLLSRP